MDGTTNIPTMAELGAQGKSPEVLFWVGCAGSFDDRAKKITKAFAKILHHAGISFAILIMNAFVPLINTYFKPRRFGAKIKSKLV